MSEKGHTFCTCLNCMDGRTQRPAAEFAKKTFGAEYVDTITEAGIDALLGDEGKEVDENTLNSLRNKLKISLDSHKSRGIIVVGHEDCAGNPVSSEVHERHIKKAVEKVRELIAPRKSEVIGIYVNLQPEPLVSEISK